MTQFVRVLSTCENRLQYICQMLFCHIPEEEKLKQDIFVGSDIEDVTNCVDLI